MHSRLVTASQFTTETSPPVALELRHRHHPPGATTSLLIGQSLGAPTNQELGGGRCYCFVSLVGRRERYHSLSERVLTSIRRSAAFFFLQAWLGFPIQILQFFPPLRLDNKTYYMAAAVCTINRVHMVSLCLFEISLTIQYSTKIYYF